MTNKEKYALLCEKEPTIGVYDQPWWMDAVCGPENWDILLYEKGDQILGTLPYYVKKKFGLKYITQPKFTQHNGPWIKYSENQSESKRISFEKEVMTNLIGQLEDLPVCFYQQSFSPIITNWQPFYWKGYSQSTNYTYRLPDIHDPSNLFEEFQHNKRKNINKARKGAFKIGYDLSATDFYQHHKKCLEKQGKAISYSQELLQKIFDAAYSHQAGKSVYLTSRDGKLLCALFNLQDKIWGYDLISAIDPETRNTGAPDLLVYTMLEYFSNKTKGYDFEGSMIEGVEESFRHFGATQTPYFNINKIYTKNPLVKAAIKYKLEK